ncbi:MAG: ATP-binding protein, partial [Planctomycetota bacterium]
RSTGTGLGLAIVHRIVDAHAGSIAVHRDPNTHGAVFTLTLPQSQNPTQSHTDHE